MNLNAVTYMYVSVTKPEYCNLHVHLLYSSWML
jgi:hypothetical protein